MNEIKRGEEAEYLLNHEIIKGAFSGVRAGIIDAMTRAPMGDAQTHNRLVIALQLLHQIETNIKDIAMTGKLASLQVKTGPADAIKRAIGL